MLFPRQRERFLNGFFIVFVVKADDYECTGSRERQQSRIKTPNLSIREIGPPLNHQALKSAKFNRSLSIMQVSYVNFMLAVIGVLGVFALFYVITFITFCLRCTKYSPWSVIYNPRFIFFTLMVSDFFSQSPSSR